MRRPTTLATTSGTALGRATLPILLAAGLLLGACDRGGDEGGSTSDASEASAGPGAAPASELPPAGAAAGFLARVAIVDLFETQASQLALERTQNADLRRYAQRMIDDHARTSQEVQALASAQRVNAAQAARLDEPRVERLNALRDARPQAFDALYVDSQVEAHENTLQIMREYADTGDNPTLKDWARRTAPVIENHLQMARALDRGSADGAQGAAPPTP